MAATVIIFVSVDSSRLYEVFLRVPAREWKGRELWWGCRGLRLRRRFDRDTGWTWCGRSSGTGREAPLLTLGRFVWQVPAGRRMLSLHQAHPASPGRRRIIYNNKRELNSWKNALDGGYRCVQQTRLHGETVAEKPILSNYFRSWDPDILLFAIYLFWLRTGLEK